MAVMNGTSGLSGDGIAISNRQQAPAKPREIPMRQGHGNMIPQRSEDQLARSGRLGTGTLSPSQAEISIPKSSNILPMKLWLAPVIDLR
jgi:hypothetical protein